MSLKDTWIDKQNTTTGLDGDDILAEDINAIAKEVIEQGEKLDKIIDEDEEKGLSTNDFTDEYKKQLDELPDELHGKVDKEEGKGLSSNDFTDEQRAKVDGLLGGYMYNINPQYEETFTFEDGNGSFDTSLTNEELHNQNFKLKVEVYSGNKKVYERFELVTGHRVTGLRLKALTFIGDIHEYYFVIDGETAYLDYEIFDLEMEFLGVNQYDRVEIYAEGLYEKSELVPMDGSNIKNGTLSYYAFDENFLDLLYHRLDENGYLPFTIYQATAIFTDRLEADLMVGFEIGFASSLRAEKALVYYNLNINGELVEGVSKPAEETAEGSEIIIGESTDYAMIAKFNAETAMLRFNFIDEDANYHIEVIEMNVVVPIPHEFIGLSRREKIATENFVKKYVDENSGSLGGEDITPLISADWNQNDETAPDHIKNRTHYEIPKVTLGEAHKTVEETTFENGFDGICDVYIDKSLVEVGKEYNYTINGQSGTFIFNNEYMDFGGTSGYVIDQGDFYDWQTSWAYGSTIDVVLYKAGKVKPLDEKYIPDSIARVSDVQAMIGIVNDELESILNGGVD